MGNRGLTVYCHFSFKRPKDKPGIGYFAVAYYSQINGGKLVAQRTVERKLWQEHQFVTAIQSYEYALSTIHEWQGLMVRAGINCVMLVTDNSILAGWIENPYKNKEYSELMMSVVRRYRLGAGKEISIGVGLCNVVKYERAYKFCRYDNIADEYKISHVTGKINVSAGSSIYDMIEESEVAGIKKVYGNRS